MRNDRDPRILRLILALHDLIVPDMSGAEHITSYDDSEILEALNMLRFSRRSDRLEWIAAALEANGTPLPKARVLTFPRKGGER